MKIEPAGVPSAARFDQPFAWLGRRSPVSPGAPAVNDVLTILVFTLGSAFNPTLLAAVTVMLLLPDPRHVMLGYLLGALLRSRRSGSLTT